MAYSSPEDWVADLTKMALKRGINLPKGKEDIESEVNDALESAHMCAAEPGPGAGGVEDMKAITEETLKILEKRLGVKKKAAGKRKADAKPAASSSSILDEVWDVSSKEKRKECVTKLIDIAKTRGVRLPEDERAARMGLGTAIMGCKEDDKVKVTELVESLVDKYGRDPAWVDPDDTAPKKKKKPSTAKQCLCPENKAMADAFDELAGLYFKAGSKAGGVYKKVVSAIKEMPEPLVKPPKKGEVPGIGAKTIEKIDEFLKTGKIQTLEDKRAELAA
eukprot:g3069.t1